MFAAFLVYHLLGSASIPSVFRLILGGLAILGLICYARSLENTRLWNEDGVATIHDV